MVIASSIKLKNVEQESVVAFFTHKSKQSGSFSIGLEEQKTVVPLAY